jgi:hypothetical protein
MRAVASVVKGRKVQPGIEALVVPGSGLVKEQAEAEGLDEVRAEFPDAVGLEPYMQAVESSLKAKGFKHDNSIALVGICRDEACRPFQERIEKGFGLSFSQCSLGGFVTMGQVGFGAAMGHCPLDPVDGRERFVFFGFPHVGVSHTGVGKIDRTGRPASGACGALLGALGAIQGADDMEKLANMPVTAEDPEFTSLVSKLAKRIHRDKIDKDSLDAKSITALSEAVIADELEDNVVQAVKGRDCDYAVITGTQINGTYLTDAQATENHYLSPGMSYCVVNGEKTDLNLDI